LFGLFNAAMGVTTVIPDMDPTRPANVDPRKIIATIRDQGVTQAFGSPAMWNRIGRYCEQHGIELPSLKRVLSAGAPVPIHVLERMAKVLTQSEADIFTPYGATESLPVCSISGREVLERTGELSRRGAGTCVGRTFPQISVRIIGITDEPIATLAEADFLPPGEIGEIVVQGPSATREYYRRPDATDRAKIADGDGFWHRMGDVGYLDEDGLLWFCGRKAHIVETQAGKMFSVPCEAIIDEHPRVYRSALVGVGPKPDQRPVFVVEPEASQFPRSPADREQFAAELRELAGSHRLTAGVETFLFHPSLPVDTRHNVKIQREKLAIWVADQIS
jgi:acyl-CoA synthetase (AMP-forming)/AMP-acid ligase II